MSTTKTEIIGTAFKNASQDYKLEGHLKGRGHIERVKLTAFYSKVAGKYLDSDLWEYVAFGSGRNSFSRVFPLDLIIRVSVLANIPFVEMSPNSDQLSGLNKALYESLLLKEFADTEESVEALGF